MDLLLQNTRLHPKIFSALSGRVKPLISQSDGLSPNIGSLKGYLKRTAEVFFCQIKKCSKIVDIRYVGQKSSELLIFRGAPPKNVSPSSSNIQKISRSIEIINFDHPRGEDGKRLQKQETYPDLMYDGAHHMVASISDGYCDTMSGTLSGLLNLTQTPKHVFHIRILFLKVVI